MFGGPTLKGWWCGLVLTREAAGAERSLAPLSQWPSFPPSAESVGVVVLRCSSDERGQHLKLHSVDSGGFPRGIKRTRRELDPQPTADLSAMVLEVCCQPQEDHRTMAGHEQPSLVAGVLLVLVPAAAASLAPRCQHLVPCLQPPTAAGSLFPAVLSSPLHPPGLLCLPKPCSHTHLCPSAPAL